MSGSVKIPMNFQGMSFEIKIRQTDNLRRTEIHSKGSPLPIVRRGEKGRKIYDIMFFCICGG